MSGRAIAAGRAPAHRRIGGPQSRRFGLACVLCAASIGSALSAHAQDTPALGSAAQDTPALGSAAQDTPALGSAAQDTPALGSAAQDTPAQGSAAQDTPAQGSAAPANSPASTQTPTPAAPAAPGVAGAAGEAARSNGAARTGGDDDGPGVGPGQAIDPSTAPSADDEPASDEPASDEPASDDDAPPAVEPPPEGHVPELGLTLSGEDELKTGGLLRVVITAMVPEGDDVTIPTQEFGGLELFASEHRVTTTPAGAREFRFQMDLLALEPGQQELPAIRVRVVTADGHVGSVLTEARAVRVGRHLGNEPDAEPRPPTQPVEVFQEDYTLAWVLGVFAALLLTALFAFFFGRWWRKRPKPEAPPPPARPPWEVALERLAALSRERGAMLAEDQAGVFVDRVSDTLREYLGARYDFNGLESTSDEILGRLRRVRLRRVSIDDVRALLADSDLIKFARAIPDEGQCAEMLAGARRIVEGTAPRPGDGSDVAPRPRKKKKKKRTTGKQAAAPTTQAGRPGPSGSRAEKQPEPESQPGTPDGGAETHSGHVGQLGAQSQPGAEDQAGGPRGALGDRWRSGGSSTTPDAAPAPTERGPTRTAPGEVEARTESPARSGGGEADERAAREGAPAETGQGAATLEGASTTLDPRARPTGEGLPLLDVAFPAAADRAAPRFVDPLRAAPSAIDGREPLLRWVKGLEQPVGYAIDDDGAERFFAADALKTLRQSQAELHEQAVARVRDALPPGFAPRTAPAYLDGGASALLVLPQLVPAGDAWIAYPAADGTLVVMRESAESTEDELLRLAGEREQPGTFQRPVRVTRAGFAPAGWPADASPTPVRPSKEPAAPPASGRARNATLLGDAFADRGPGEAADAGRGTPAGGPAADDPEATS